jgi:hypothetical protein
LEALLTEIKIGDRLIGPGHPTYIIAEIGVNHNGIPELAFELVDIGAYEYNNDITAPTVLSSLRANPNPTNAAVVHFTVTFSELVTGVDASDFTLTTNGVSGASITGVSGSGSIYTVTVGTGSGLGTIRLDVPDDATVTDLTGNLLTGLPFTGSQFYTISEMWDIFLPLVIH